MTVISHLVLIMSWLYKQCVLLPVIRSLFWWGNHIKKQQTTILNNSVIQSTFIYFCERGRRVFFFGGGGCPLKSANRICSRFNLYVCLLQQKMYNMGITLLHSGVTLARIIINYIEIGGVNLKTRFENLHSHTPGIVMVIRAIL